MARRGPGTGDGTALPRAGHVSAGVSRGDGANAVDPNGLPLPSQPQLQVSTSDGTTTVTDPWGNTINEYELPEFTVHLVTQDQFLPTAKTVAVAVDADGKPIPLLDDIKRLDLWPTTYVSDRMDELPLHWHDFDNCGYLLEGSGYILDEAGEHCGRQRRHGQRFFVLAHEQHGRLPRAQGQPLDRGRAVARVAGAVEVLEPGVGDEGGIRRVGRESIGR